MSTASEPPNHWLSDCICDLMASPHISLPAHPGMHFGPGPVDVFTTRFDKYFTRDARGTICGAPVDRDGMKNGLLALQKRWNPKEVKIELGGTKSGCQLHHDVLSTTVEWTPPGNSLPEVISAQASLNGEEHIRFLKLEGNLALFRV